MLGGLEFERVASELFFYVKQELKNTHCKGNVFPVHGKKAYGGLEV